MWKDLISAEPNSCEVYHADRASIPKFVITWEEMLNSASPAPIGAQVGPR